MRRPCDWWCGPAPADNSQLAHYTYERLNCIVHMRHSTWSCSCRQFTINSLYERLNCIVHNTCAIAHSTAFLPFFWTCSLLFLVALHGPTSCFWCISLQKLCCAWPDAVSGLLLCAVLCPFAICVLYCVRYAFVCCTVPNIYYCVLHSVSPAAMWRTLSHCHVLDCIAPPAAMCCTAFSDMCCNVSH